MRTDYEIFDKNEQLIFSGKGKSFSTTSKFFDQNNNHAFSIGHTGLFKRIFFLKIDGKILCQVDTKSLLFKKEFTFNYQDRIIIATATGNWKSMTFYDQDREVAKISRTRSTIFSPDEYALAMNDNYDPIIFLGVVVILNQIKSLQEQGS